MLQTTQINKMAYHIKRIKNKTKQSFQRSGKSIAQNSTFILIKILNNLGIKGIYLNIKSHISYLIYNTTPNCEKRKDFLLQSRKRQEGSLSSLGFDIALEVSTKAIREEKEIIDIQTEKEETKLHLFVNDRILYTENPDNYQKTARTMIKFSSVSGYKNI